MAKRYRNRVSIFLTTVLSTGTALGVIADGVDPQDPFYLDAQTKTDTRNSNPDRIERATLSDPQAASKLPAPPQKTSTKQTSALEPLNAEYAVRSPQGNASANVKLAQNADGTWTQAQDVSLLFFQLTDEAHFRVEDHTVVPLRYQQRRNIGAKRNQNINFDWKNRVVEDTKQGWQTSLKPGFLDQFTMLLQLQLDLLNQRFGEQKTYTVVAKKGRIKNYTIVKDGEEILATDLGDIQTLRLKQSREGSDRKTTIWLAPEHNYLMVKTLRLEDDEESELNIKSATLSGKAI